MTEEYQSTIKNDVWEIVPRPKSKDVVYSMLPSLYTLANVS
jgi:hypothetical protein